MFRKSKKQQAKLQESLLGVINSKITQTIEMQSTKLTQDINDNKIDKYDSATNEKSYNTKMQTMTKLKIA